MSGRCRRKKKVKENLKMGQEGRKHKETRKITRRKVR
jgi:hypothetical protein